MQMLIASTADRAEPVLPRAALERVVARLRAGRRIPRATYRVQFNRDFTFAQARELVAYLDALGVSDLYASPFLQAHPESTHGYDIHDHNTLNPSIGDEAAFRAFAAALHERGMGQILDMVPNHMGIAGNDNRWWLDVLENGRSSAYAAYFDVDWEPLRNPELHERVLLPVLGGPYGQVLEKGELQLAYRDGAFVIEYWERHFPVDPATYDTILEACLGHLTPLLPADEEQVLELQSIATAARNLPPHGETEPARVLERRREKEIVKRRLHALGLLSPEVAAALRETVAGYNGTVGDPARFDRLDALLRRQAYRLAYWRVAAEEINYRRFFDVNDLAGIRVEEPAVFDDTHRLVLRLLAEGCLTGLRIDHPDGLWDPAGYLRRLQRAYVIAVLTEELREHGLELPQPLPEAEGDALLARLRAVAPGEREFEADLDRPLYVTVEKILTGDEPLPPDWPVDGTTGYDFTNAVNGLFVNPAARPAFDAIYEAFVPDAPAFGPTARASKDLVMRAAFPGDINELGFLLKRIASRNRWYQDFTLNGLTFAVRQVIAAMPRYRTYRVCELGQPISPGDRATIEAAIRAAIRGNRATAYAIFQFIRELLLLEDPGRLAPEDRPTWCRFVMKFQQTTGPIMAKGVEDTAFYIANRLVSLNEVGGEPDRFGLSVAEFHRQNAARARDWPHAQLATSTHDTKRGEDVRARINVLSELPEAWRANLERWRALNEPHRVEVEGDLAPDLNLEYLLYQMLLGAWPLELDRGSGSDRVGLRSFAARIVEYMRKAMREAKVHTTWINANEAYESAVAEFVEAILDPARSADFLDAFRPLQTTVAHFGMLNALAQALLKLASPGVPDIYQGSELWNLSLVDPDNRRPVDYALRERLLAGLNARRLQPGGDAPHGTRAAEHRAALAADLLGNWQDGCIKLWLTVEALHLRSRCPALFAHGDYRPLATTGPHANHVVAFARTLNGQCAVAAVPRFSATLLRGELVLPLGDAVWSDTRVTLPADFAGTCLRDIYSHRGIAATTTPDGLAIRAADLFAVTPFALLIDADSAGSGA